MKGTETYFHAGNNTAFTHYIVYGNINDIFTGYSTAPVSLCEELSEHLLRQGFDAVIYVDSQTMLYSLNIESYHVLMNGSPVPAAVASGADEVSLMADSPFGRRMHRRNSTPEGASPSSGDIPVALNLSRMNSAMAFDRVGRLMQNPNLKCAFVFANADSFSLSFSEDMLQILEELGAGSINHSIAIYVYAHNKIEDIMASMQTGSCAWQKFAQSTLIPRINNPDPDKNALLYIGPPTPGEIRNLILGMTMRKEHPLKVYDIGQLSVELATHCANKELSLAEAYLMLDGFACRYPDVEAGIDTWQQLTGQAYPKSPMEVLDSMIGLQNFKEAMHARFDAYKDVDYAIQPRSSRLEPRDTSPPKVDGHELNMVLCGNPGTGKSTIAELMGMLYRENGLLPSGHTVFASAADIIGEHVGETSRNMRRLLDRAVSGVLVIDEAYALLNNSFGSDAIDQLVADLTSAEYQGRLGVVLTGYPEPMQALLDKNAGLNRRFPNQYLLPDYNASEMQQLLLRFAGQSSDVVRFDPQLTKPVLHNDGTISSLLDDFCAVWVDSKIPWENSGEAENLLHQMKQNCARRAGNQNGFLLTAEDIPDALKYCLDPKCRNMDEALKQLEQLIGLKAAKKYLRAFAVSGTWKKKEEVPNIVLSGPPGTGKTHVARLLADILYLLGVTKRRCLIETTASDFVSAENPDKALEDAVRSAKNGVFFLDEAHQLQNSDTGLRLLRNLVPLIECPEVRENTVIVLAGYKLEMTRLFVHDGGLTRRFPEAHRIHFQDYNAAELRQLLELFARNKGLVPSEAFLDRSEAAFERYLQNRPANFGNAGFIRDHFLNQSVQMLAERLNSQYAQRGAIVASQTAVAAVPVDEKNTLTEYDVPRDFQRLAPLGEKPLRKRGIDIFDYVRDQLIGKDRIIEYAGSFRPHGEEAIVFQDEQAPGLSYAISGPAGVGKKTCVRLLGSLMAQQDLLETEHVHFVSDPDLVAGYVGQTALKAREVCQTTLGGILCVLNPSSMLKGGNNSFGIEALNVVCSYLNTPGISIVFLDSDDGMNAFLNAFPDVREMMPVFRLGYFSPEEMQQLFYLKSKENFAFDEELQAMLPVFFKNWISSNASIGTGCEIDTLLDALRQNWKKAKGAIDRTDINPRRVITKDMLPKNLQCYLPKK